MSLHEAECIYNCGATDCTAPDAPTVSDWQPSRIKPLAISKIKKQPFYKIMENNMKDDYQSEAERSAYAKGVVTRINGLDKTANHYLLPRTRKAWLEGFEEKGSIKDKAK